MHFGVLVNGAAYLIVKRFLGPFRVRRRWLKQTQWLSRPELLEIQLDLLKKMVRHCYDTVPYYRKLMDKRGITVNSINTLDDIKRFPVLTKHDVLQAGDAIISTKYPMWILHKARTGGSTGTPMIVCRDLFSIGNEHAFVRRQWDWAGIGLRDKCAYLVGRVVAQRGKEKARLYAYDPIMQELTLSTYHLSSDTAMEYAKLIKDYRVKAIMGYPSAVYLLAKTCIDSGFKLSLRAALTSCETLTDSMRNTISGAFGCKVYDFYGAAERVVYIHTCERGNYHIIPEYGLTELVSLGEYEDSHCKVISTGFWNRAMPLVRYDTGDIVVKTDSTCSCGRKFRVIKSIIGREGDVIKIPSGEKLGVTILVHLLYVVCGANNILETQFIQDARDHITVEYVPGRRFSNDAFSMAKKQFVEHVPKELRVDFKQVSAVRKTDSGKLRPVISQIASQDCRLQGQLQ